MHLVLDDHALKRLDPAPLRCRQDVPSDQQRTSIGKIEDPTSCFGHVFLQIARFTAWRCAL